MKKLCLALEQELADQPPSPATALKLQKIVRRFPRATAQGTPTPTAPFYKKSAILQYYLANSPSPQPHLVQLLQVKPIRTQSGVATITILTKPYPCPGQCIFCPADIRMPKSYLNAEPGAQRAETNYFDPYLQTLSRLENLAQMGHSTDKVELIILGGTWTAYPAPYQRWFVKEALRALNEFKTLAPAAIATHRAKQTQIYLNYQAQVAAAQLKTLSNDKAHNALQFQTEQAILTRGGRSYNQLVHDLYLAPEERFGLAAAQSAAWPELLAAQERNATAPCRNVGLVIETRPDEISPQVLTDIRRLGCTKIQIGVQSVNDTLLQANRRGTSTTQIARAFALLRLYGFKIHAHFMANLYTATPQIDQADFQEFFRNPAYRPDELKMYPCSLIESAPLHQFYQRGTWRPYSEAELLEVLVANLLHTPAYCRLTRMIRDISSHDIVTGNKKTNFRQLVDQAIQKSGGVVQEIRSREIKNRQVTKNELELQEIVYATSVSREYFLQYVTKDTGQIAAFLRLSLPNQASLEQWLSPAEIAQVFPTELKNAAIIREIHVYGHVAEVGEKNATGHKAQHLGLGTELIARAEQIAVTATHLPDSPATAPYTHLAVISALGTKEYYARKGFSATPGQLYQIKSLTSRPS